MTISDKGRDAGASLYMKEIRHMKRGSRMTDIKTREVIKGTIKTFDRAGTAGHRIRDAGIRTKESAEEAYKRGEESPSGYAQGKAYEAGRSAAKRAGRRTYETGRREACDTARRLTGRLKDDTVKSADAASRAAVKQSVKAARPSHSVQIKSIQSARKKLFVRRRQQAMIQRKAAVKTARAVFVNTVRAAKLAVSGVKALVSAIIAGGWAAVIIIIICCLFGGALYLFGDSSDTGYIPVSDEVEQYSSLINKFAKESGISEYTELIKAVMMQESGGRGSDPMQASECGYNKKYPHTPGGITDPEYSVKCGVQMLTSVLKAAGCKSPSDMDHIRLALQGYNFGSGYITWALAKHGGYSKANAVEFSNLQAKKAGVSSYGDPDYVEHVLRYYPYGNSSYSIVNTGPGKLGLPIENMKKSNITSAFGHRSSPGGIGSTNHKGIDIAFPTGTHVLACEAGKVEVAGWYGGFGKCIIISHGGGLKTVYGHLSKINVSKGQAVVRGQFIGEVGSTGNSTGPHLHLGVMVNGSYVDPQNGWLSVP